MTPTRNLLASLVCSSALIAGGASAAVNFVFTYTDVGVGFNDPGQGAGRRAALETAADIVEALFVNYTADIQMSVDGSVTADATLAAAGSNGNGALTVGFGNRGDVGLKILGGNAADPAVGTADGTVTWNFEDHQWELGNDFQAGEFDFISTAAHELLHAVGFLSNIGQNGEDLSPAPENHWGPFDQYVADSTGRVIAQTGPFAIDSGRFTTGLTGGTGTVPATNGLYFDGPNANAANGGNPVPLYTPNPYEGGSSGSHLDDNYFNGTTAAKKMMNAATEPGLSARSLSSIEIGILQDLGFTNVMIPEPSAITLLLVGFLGLVTRRRR